MNTNVQNIRDFNSRDDRLKYLSGFLLYASNNNFDLSVKGLCKRLFNNHDSNNIRKIQRDIKYLTDEGIIKITKRFYKGSVQFFKVCFLRLYKGLRKTTKKISSFFCAKKDQKIKTDHFKLKVNKLNASCQGLNRKKIDDLFLKLDYLNKRGIKKIDISTFIYAFQASQTQKINNFPNFYHYILTKTNFRIDFKHLNDYLQKENIDKYIKVKHFHYYDIKNDYDFKAPYCNILDWKRIKSNLLAEYCFDDVFLNVVSQKDNILDNNLDNNNNNLTVIAKDSPYKAHERSQFDCEQIADEFHKLRSKLKLAEIKSDYRQ